jgi:hypothetical protein
MGTLVAVERILFLVLAGSYLTLYLLGKSRKGKEFLEKNPGEGLLWDLILVWLGKREGERSLFTLVAVLATLAFMVSVVVLFVLVTSSTILAAYKVITRALG